MNPGLTPRFGTTGIERPLTIGDLRRADISGGNYLTNHVETGRKLLPFLSRCTAPADLSEETLGDETFFVRWYFCHPVDLVDNRSGGMNRQIRTVLVDTKDRTLGFVSSGVAAALERIVSVVGPGEFLPPLPVRVVKTRTGGGHEVMSLVVQEEGF